MSTKIIVKSYTATYYCKCGASIKLTGTNHQPALQWWSKGHQGEGHGPCDRKTCMKARKEQES